MRAWANGDSFCPTVKQRASVFVEVPVADPCVDQQPWRIDLQDFAVVAARIAVIVCPSLVNMNGSVDLSNLIGRR